MKIHGTAKGGAINKKDFGVAFGGGGASGSVSGEGLKVYIKFSDASGNPANTAGDITDNDTLGSGADITLGGTGTMVYGVTGTPANLGNATTFPQTDTDNGRWGVFGTSTSQFNFMWSTEGSGLSPTWTMCCWMKTSVSQTAATSLLDCNEGEGTKGFEIYWNNTTGISLNMTNGLSGNPNGRPFDYAQFTDFSTDGNWHFYAFTMDGDLGSNQYKVRRDAEAIQEFSKTAGNFANSGNSEKAMEWRTQGTYPYIPPTTSYVELSIWDRVLTDEELTTLYNSGDGFQLS